MDLLIILYLIFYLILAKIRLEWAVMLILAALPSYLIRFEILGIPFTLLEAMILASFFIWFIFQTEFRNFIRGKYSWRDFLENRKKREAYPFGLEIILLLVISFMAAAVAGFSDSALGIWKAYFFEPALVFILILNVFVRKKDTNIRMNANDTNGRYEYTNNANDANNTNAGSWEKVLWALSVSALAVAGLAIYQKFTGVWIFNEFWAEAGNRRVTSFFGYPNAVGLYLGPLVLILIGWLVQQVKAIKKQVISYKLLVILIIIILSGLSVYFAKSKGAILGVAAGLVIFFLLAVGKKIRWGMIFLILAAIIGVSAYQPLRNFTLDKTIYSKSLQIREQQWKETWEMLKDSRLISGAGLANYQKSIVPYHQEGIFLRDYNDPDWHRKTVFNAEYRAKVWQPLEIYLYPHNIFLNFWSELGLAGLLLFSWIVLKFFYIGVKMLRQRVISYGLLVMGLLSAMVVIVVHGLVDVPYFKNDLAVMFWALVAMISAQCLTHNKRDETQKHENTENT